MTDTVNDPPFLGTISNPTTAKNTAVSFSLPFTELNAGDTDTFAVGRIVNTANGPVFTTIDPSQATATVDATGHVTVTPATGFVGTFTLTVGVRDAQDRIGSTLGLNDARNFDTQQITVTVNDGTTNTPPTISVIANQTTHEGTAIGPIAFTVGDAETSVTNLTVSVQSSNQTLVPTASVVLGGSAANRTITITPAAGQTGTATLTVTVADGSNLTASKTFTLTVTAPGTNTPPTISNIPNQTTSEGTAIGPIGFTVGDAETSVTDLTVSVSSSNTTLVPSANAVFGGSGSNRTLTVTPAAGQTGTTTISVTVHDSSNLTTTDTFDLTVTVPPPTSPPTVTLTSSKSSIGTNHNVLFDAEVSSGTGSVQFLDGTNALATVPVVDGKAFLTTSFGTAASHSVTAKFIPTSGASVTSSATAVTVTSATAPVIITAEGSAAGTEDAVTIKNQDGSIRFTEHPYPGFTGLVRVKVADVTGDGQLDAIAVPGFGGGPLITVYDGNTGNLVYQKMIYEDFFRGGLSLDVGDAKGLGYSQILVGAGLTGGPRVTLLDAVQDKVLLNYFAYNSSNRGGVSVAISDLRGGNVNNIITGAATAWRRT